MRNRIDLARYFRKLGFKKGAEIGVFTGYFSKVLLDTIPGLNLLSVDPYHRQTIHAKLYPKTVSLLSKYPNSTILKGFSVDVAKLITDDSLDFVYIDGDHSYNAVKSDVESWVPKVRRGGIVAGDDYYIFKSGEDGVVRAVDEYAKYNGYKLNIIDWNNRGRHRDNFQPQWWFIK